MGCLALQPANDALPAVDLDEIAIAKPACNPRNRYDGRNTDFSRNDGGVRKQAAALHDQTGRCGKQHHPPWIRTFGHQDAPGWTRCGRRFLYHTNAPTYSPGARSKSLALFPVVERFLIVCFWLELVSLVHRLVRLDAVRRPRLTTH